VSAQRSCCFRVFQFSPFEPIARRGASRHTYLRAALGDLAEGMQAVRKALYAARAATGVEVVRFRTLAEGGLAALPEELAELKAEIEVEFEALPQGYAGEPASLDRLEEAIRGWTAHAALRLPAERAPAEVRTPAQELGLRLQWLSQACGDAHKALASLPGIGKAAAEVHALAQREAGQAPAKAD